MGRTTKFLCSGTDWGGRVQGQVREMIFWVYSSFCTVRVGGHPTTDKRVERGHCQDLGSDGLGGSVMAEQAWDSGPFGRVCLVPLVIAIQRVVVSRITLLCSWNLDEPPILPSQRSIGAHSYFLSFIFEREGAWQSWRSLWFC